MNAAEFRTYGFAVQYRCWIRTDVPSEGPVVAFPAGSDSGDPDRLLVVFAPVDGLTWTGSFLREFRGCADMVFATPDPSTACVVAGGLAWVVDVNHRRAVPLEAVPLEMVPVSEAFGYPAGGMVFISTLDTVYAFDASMTMQWRTRLPHSDGISFEGIKGGSLKVLAYTPSLGDSVALSLSLADGVASEDAS